MDRQAAFDVVSKVIYDQAVSLLVGGNPAYEGEACLRHIELVAQQWGYSTKLITPLLDSISEQNDFMRDLEGGSYAH